MGRDTWWTTKWKSYLILGCYVYSYCCIINDRFTGHMIFSDDTNTFILICSICWTRRLFGLNSGYLYFQRVTLGFKNTLTEYILKLHCNLNQHYLPWLALYESSGCAIILAASHFHPSRPPQENVCLAILQEKCHCDPQLNPKQNSNWQD